MRSATLCSLLAICAQQGGHFAQVCGTARTHLDTLLATDDDANRLLIGDKFVSLLQLRGSSGKLDIGVGPSAQNEAVEWPEDENASSLSLNRTEKENEKKGKQEKQKPDEEKERKEKKEKKEEEKDDKLLGAAAAEGGDPGSDNETVKEELEKVVDSAIVNATKKEEAKEHPWAAKDKQEKDEELPANTNISNTESVREEVDKAINETVRKQITEEQDKKDKEKEEAEKEKAAKKEEEEAAKNDTKANASTTDGAETPAKSMQAPKAEAQGKAKGKGNATLTDNNTDDLDEVIKDLSGEVVVQEIMKNVDKALNKTKEKASEEHREPTQEELRGAAKDEIERLWGVIWRAKRYGPGGRFDHGFSSFFNSVAVYGWCLLLATTCISLCFYKATLELPSTTAYHGVALLLWFTIAACYDVLIFARLGHDDGVTWLNGYILEIIFLIENVFVFHIVVKAFDMPRKMTQRILFIVVGCQIVFQMVFYMGLADTLRGLDVLPYLLGPWLIYCGGWSMFEDTSHDSDTKDSTVIQTAKTLLGDRLELSRDKMMKGLVVKSGGLYRVTLSGLCTFCLLLADFLLEIDVTVTKIESMQNQYLCFSSSVVASFAMPELFFVARDIFKEFAGLTYAIGGILIFFGCQMLLHDVFALTVMANITVMMLMLLMGLLASICFGLGKGYKAPPTPHVSDASPTADSSDN